MLYYEASSPITCPPRLPIDSANNPPPQPTSKHSYPFKNLYPHSSQYQLKILLIKSILFLL